MRDLLLVGCITSAKGLKGEIKIIEKSAEFNYLEIGDSIFIEGIFDTFIIEKIREVKNNVYLQLKGVQSIDRAQQLLGKNFYIDAANKKQPEDEYYKEDLMGLQVYDVQGEFLGEVVDVMDNSVQYILSIAKNDKEWMLPFVDAFIKEIDMDQNKLIVEVIEGMID